MTKLSKLDMRRKRVEILSEIDRLEKERCDFCSSEAWSHNTNKSSCNCEASVEVIELGNQLLKLVSNRKTIDLEVIERPDVENMKLENLTVELYKKMKLSRIRDIDIIRKMAIGGDRFYEWKREVGLIK